LSEVAARAGLTRAAARRFLLTLETLGYVRSNGRKFSLRPQILELGHAYLSALTIPDVALPYLEHLANQTGTASSVSVLENKDIVYVARVATRRIMSVNIHVGTRFPAVSTSMGRAMLAFLPQRELDVFLEDVEFTAFTEKSITDMDSLRAELANVRKLGYCVIDQELELGLYAVAVPIMGADRRPLAALNVSFPSFTGDVKPMVADLIQPLTQHARAIERDLLVVGTGSPVVLS
ncbi:MAG: helix-turn-helix domain-containing protein, partial [Propionibacteriaceae bacterium]|nr:helix-turn-helix domain-containing protein [Propionibacteriaceae bacterium]